MAKIDFYMNVNQYRDNDKKPHYWSKLELPIDFLKAVTNNAKEGDFSINAAAWIGENKKGNKYILVRLEDGEFKKANGNGGRQSPPAERSGGDASDSTGSSGRSQGWDGGDDIPF